VKYIPDAGCSHEPLKQHDADAFHRPVFRHCCRLRINRTIDLLFLRSSTCRLNMMPLSLAPDRTV
jgi:hypothetical protein